MHEKVLPGGTATVLETIGKSGLLSQAYLAGGTAMALQLGHRISRDLDFFTPEPFEEKDLAAELEEMGLQTEDVRWRTVIGMFDDVHFSCFYLPYPLIFEPIEYLGVRVADLRDCAIMKFEAIGRRGTQRDFVDLHAIMNTQNVSISDLIDMHKKRYGEKHNTRVHNFRSLTYFVEAEAEQDRPLEPLVPINWEEIKAFFRKEVEKTSRELLQHRGSY